MDSDARRRLTEAVEQARARAEAAVSETKGSPTRRGRGELLDSYDTGWRQNTDARFEHHYPGDGFADLLWKGNVLVAMNLLGALGRRAPDAQPPIGVVVVVQMSRTRSSASAAYAAIVRMVARLA